MTKTERVQNYLRDNPDAQTEDIARELGISKRTVRRARQLAREATGMPRILLFDVETSPMEVYTWSLFNKFNIPPDNIVKEWAVLCWAAKWLYESNIFSEVVSAEDAMHRRDASIMQNMWNLFNDADIIIAHNAARFDVRKLNLRFLKAGLPPPKPYRVIDTLKEMQKYFAASSHKLDAIAETLELARKEATDFSLWKRCVTGSDVALLEMRNYCKQDVVVLEDLYTKVRPWIKSHPNMGLYLDTDKTVCPNCGSDELEWDGSYYTNAGRYKAFRCKCGAVGRSRHSDVPQTKTKNLAISVAR